MDARLIVLGCEYLNIVSGHVYVHPVSYRFSWKFSRAVSSRSKPSICAPFAAFNRLRSQKCESSRLATLSSVVSLTFDSVTNRSFARSLPRSLALVSLDSPHFSFEGNNWKSWKKRYIEIQENGMMVYFSEKGGEKKGDIDLVNCETAGKWSDIPTADKLKDVGDLDRTFAVKMADRTFTMIADDESACM